MTAAQGWSIAERTTSITKPHNNRIVRSCNKVNFCNHHLGAVANHDQLSPAMGGTQALTLCITRIFHHKLAQFERTQHEDPSQYEERINQREVPGRSRRRERSLARPRRELKLPLLSSAGWLFLGGFLLSEGALASVPAGLGSGIHKTVER